MKTIHRLLIAVVLGILPASLFAQQKVTVLGAVARPAPYIVNKDANVLVLLQVAGGMSPSADIAHITVSRPQGLVSLNLRPLLVKGVADTQILNFRFEEGDVLTVPSLGKYRVLGQVVKPSSYIFSEQNPVTVVDALMEAGGQTPRANLNRAYLLRTVNGKMQAIKVDFDAINKKGLASANLQILSDDILIIPQKKKTEPTIGDLFAPLNLLNFLGFYP